MTAKPLTEMKESNMLKKSYSLTASLCAASLLFAGLSIRAEHEKEMRGAKDPCSASEIIGKKVTNAQDEDLGKVHDLIVNIGAGTVPYAIIAHGGVLGRTKIGVSLESLRPSADGKSLILSATKEQLQAAGKTTNSAWAPVVHGEWAKNVDGFYGQPSLSWKERFARDRNPTDDRTFVRDPAPKGAELLMTPEDAALCEKVCENTDAISVRVHNGVTHLYGQVENEEARKNIESKVRSIQGVNKVESHLRVKNQ
jgi:hypothetical protein